VRDLEKAARIAARIEHRIREQVRNVDHVALRYEPLRKEVWRYVIPLDDREGTVSRHFGDAPFFALADVRASERELLTSTIVDNPYLELEKGKGIRVSEFLVGQEMDFLVLREHTHGRGPEYVLRDAGVEVEMTDRERLEEVLRELGVRALGAAGERVKQ
jgi:predicted Fe-Mo cluster-binding NifX family protein